MVFNEDEIFLGNLGLLIDQLKKVTLEDIQETLQKALLLVPGPQNIRIGIRLVEEWIEPPAGMTEGDLNLIAEALILLAQTAQIAKEAGLLQEGLKKPQELTRIIRGMPLPPPIPLVALQAVVIGIKRAEPITEKVSFHLLTKKAYGYKGQPVESVLQQEGYNNDIQPAAFIVGRKIIKHLVLGRGL